MSFASMEMPKYECHKKVWALKIKNLVGEFVSDFVGEDAHKPDGAIITPEDPRYEPFKVDQAYVEKHKPVIDGYYIVYADGYKSFSPADAFESGYTLIK